MNFLIVGVGWRVNLGWTTTGVLSYGSSLVWFLSTQSARLVKIRTKGGLGTKLCDNYCTGRTHISLHLSCDLRSPIPPRYERELNGGTRPPLRQIATQDAPASCPMVLCVSDITWSPAGLTDNGMPIESHPELEVTDGWYRIRAQVDEPLARAVRKGVIRIGRKIAVAGARVSSIP